jgi:hypothetical protein
MTQIEKLHLDAINSPTAFTNTDLIKELAASKSAQITEDIAIEFFDWIDKLTRKSEIVNKNNGSFIYNDRYYISSELFQEFLKTKQ